MTTITDGARRLGDDRLMVLSRSAAASVSSLVALALIVSGCSAVEDAATSVVEDAVSTESTLPAPPPTTDPPGAVRAELNLADIPADAVPFADPEGVYVVDIAPTWVQDTSASEPGVEVWLTGEGTDTFRNNVNIRTSPIEETGTTQIGELIDASWNGISESIPAAALNNSGSIAQAADPNSGFLQWEADLQGQKLDFITYYGLWNGQLVTLTYTQASGGPDVFQAVIPYIVTLRRPE